MSDNPEGRIWAAAAILMAAGVVVLVFAIWITALPLMFKIAISAVVAILVGAATILAIEVRWRL